MIKQNPILGKLVSIHPVSPAFLQRGVIISVLSFLFFLGTMFAFYVSRNPLYFLLSTAFLIVYIATMFSWISVRKHVLILYEKGFQYENFLARWDEIDKLDIKVTSRFFSNPKIECKLQKKNGEKVVLTESISRINEVIDKMTDEI
jgi:magnesium-transporting ATPase (P-type)